ncbi:unnamed protein product, partial [Heterosigma akashiwo]
MGNVQRMLTYNRSANMANAVHVLDFHGSPLVWHRLDDGVMGGRSETHLDALRAAAENPGPLKFMGTINTNGGGFTSIRAPLPPNFLSDMSALKIKYRGDGKTYKILLSDGKGGGPMSNSPSWQVDLHTSQLCGPDDEPQEVVIPFDTFIPSFGGRSTLSVEDRNKYTFMPSHMLQLGIMLSLRLSDGSPNPVETFGDGIFDYVLEIYSVEAMN